MSTKKKSVPARKLATKKQPVKKPSKKIRPPEQVFIDHFVPIEVANKMIEQGQAAGLLPAMQFSADSIREILAQKEVAFLRIYAVINANGAQTYLLTGGSVNHQRIDVIRKRKKSKTKTVASRGSGDTVGAMNIAQVCDPVKKIYGAPSEG